jgi:uncharacterized membrane protein SpoIIM required for sporulation
MKELGTMAWRAFRSSIQRNKTILKVTSVSFFIIISVSVFLTLYAFTVAPWFVDWLRSLIKSELLDADIPRPFTTDLYFFIFLNNAGHFWNPAKMVVWVPLVGSFLIGLELLLNGVVIGALAVFVGITRGVLYPIVGLTPHGVFEIPAFILQFASIIRWHVTTIEFVMVKIVGERVERSKIKQDLKDIAVLSVASVTLFMIAAYIETYVTPYLLGM